MAAKKYNAKTDPSYSCVHFIVIPRSFI